MRSRLLLGLTCLNDVTARELQEKDIQYTRAKGFDTFAPLGPCIVPASTTARRTASASRAGSTDSGVSRRRPRELVFSIDQLVAFVTRVMTLLPGDIIATGTPAGIGPLASGDVVTIKVAGVGELTNPVK